MTGPRSLSLAIDVGGTNTDAVVLDGRRTLVARTKEGTTSDVGGGIRAAVTTLLDVLGEESADVTRVMLGTTHATNAILERRALAPTAVVRIGLPATTEVPPLSGWPADLSAAAVAASTSIAGGVMVDGWPIAPLDEDALGRFLDGLPDVRSFAVTGVFSTAAPEHELRVAELIRERLGEDAWISLGHEIGSIGLLERENATVLNSALAPAIAAVARSLEVVLAERGSSAMTYFAQNDGTLMTVEHALRFPVLTIGSGPANSLRGAAVLAGVEEAIIADVGGTSTDFGVLSGGFPRESTQATDIGGIRTNFRMPDVLSLALGGGTIVRDEAEGLQVGPESVGYRLRERALAFGGDAETLTDAALLGGRSPRGLSAPSVVLGVRTRLAAALAHAEGEWAAAIDRLSLGRDDLPIVAVGGGSFMIPDGFPGAGEVIRPDDGDVANAIGAGIAPVSGRAEVLLVGSRDRRDAVEEATELARDKAVHAGAAHSTLRVIEVSDAPMSYVRDAAVRITVKVAGDLEGVAPPS